MRTSGLSSSQADLLVFGDIVQNLLAWELLRYRFATRLLFALMRIDRVGLAARLALSSRDRGEHFGFVEQHSLIGRDVRRALLRRVAKQLRPQPVNLFQKQRVELDELLVFLFQPLQLLEYRRVRVDICRLNNRTVLRYDLFCVRKALNGLHAAVRTYMPR
jgi:hypothetical protein